MFFLRVFLFCFFPSMEETYLRICMYIHVLILHIVIFIYNSISIHHIIIFFSPTPLPEWPSHSSVQGFSVGPCS